MTERERTEYFRTRRKNPYLPAKYAMHNRPVLLDEVDEKDWRQGPCWTLRRDGFDIEIDCEAESTAPKSDDGYGEYVDRSYYSEYPVPGEQTPMGLPASHFVWSHSYSGPEFFFPDYVEDQFNYFRSQGASKSVARDLTCRWIEDYITDMQGLTYWFVNVSASRNGIELAQTGIGTTTLEVNEEDDLLNCVSECALIDEVTDEAKHNLDLLVATNE